MSRLDDIRAWVESAKVHGDSGVSDEDVAAMLDVVEAASAVAAHAHGMPAPYFNEQGVPARLVAALRDALDPLLEEP